MNSRIELVRRSYELCCSWGARTVLPSKDFVGGPVPLLRNPQRLMSQRMAVFNIGFMVATLILFVVLYTVTTDEQNTTYEANKAAAITQAIEDG